MRDQLISYIHVHAMKKKTYQRPEIKSIQIDTNTILCVSGGVMGGYIHIGPPGSGFIAD